METEQVLQLVCAGLLLVGFAIGYISGKTLF